MKQRLRLTCHSCDNRVILDFYAMRKHETAHKELLRHKWIFGVARDEEGGVLFDALCEECGRGVVKQMLDAGGGIDPDAKKRLREIYPDLFEKPESN